MAIGGALVAGSVNFSSEPVGATYDSGDGLVYLATYTPINAITGMISNYILVVSCSACNGVTITESGVSGGSTWGVTVSNATTLYAETAYAVAPSSIGLHLANGNYLVRVSGPGTVSLGVASQNATYSAATNTLVVSGTGSRIGGGVAGPHPMPLAWLIIPSAGLAAASLVAGVFLRAQRLRRQGEELVDRMRNAVREGSREFRRPK